MQLADKYLPETIEQKWYDFWIDNNLFHSEPDEREPYTIVIPPPNVTGMLHMGDINEHKNQGHAGRPGFVTKG